MKETIKNNIVVDLKDVSVCDYFSKSKIKYWNYSDYVHKHKVKKVFVNLPHHNDGANVLLLEFIVTRKKVYYHNTRSIYDLSISDFQNLVKGYKKYDLSHLNWTQCIHIFRQLSQANVRFIPLEDCLYWIESDKFDGLEISSSS